MDVLKDLENFIINELTAGLGITSLMPDEDLLEQGIIDSMRLMKLITFIEETYGISVTDEEIVPENFQRLNSIVALVQKKLLKK